jgi:hypothetical protein
MASLIEQEKEKGRVRPGTDAYLAASSIFYLYMGVLREFLRNPELGVAKARNILSATLKQHLAGILI